MKKSFVKPQVSMQVLPANSIMEASQAVNDTQVPTGTGGLAKQGTMSFGAQQGGVSTLSRMTTWAMGKMDF